MIGSYLGNEATVSLGLFSTMIPSLNRSFSYPVVPICPPPPPPPPMFALFTVWAISRDPWRRFLQFLKIPNRLDVPFRTVPRFIRFRLAVRALDTSGCFYPHPPLPPQPLIQIGWFRAHFLRILSLFHPLPIPHHHP
jgi:hypothetical protein